MREILFRGKRLTDEKWLVGYYLDELVHKTAFPCIVPLRVCPNDHDWAVDKKTVGQFTGLLDVNGKKIFEGDVVRLHYFFENRDPNTLGRYEDEAEIVCKIVSLEFGWGFKTREGLQNYLSNYIETATEEITVIGNIYDNPELLEAEQ